MSSTITIQLGVQAAPGFPEIHVGQLNEAGDTMINPIDMTNEVVGAVAQFVVLHHKNELKGVAQQPDGSMVYFEFTAVPLPIPTQGVTP